jgi:superfamily II DNA or RNA helicase
MTKVNIRFNAAICKIEGLNSDILEAIKSRFRVELTEERYQDYKNKTRLPLTKEGSNYYLVEEFNKHIQIPTGLLLKLVNYLKTLRIGYNLHKQIQPAQLERKSYISLRQEQQLAIDKFITNKRGIIKAPTSWGKSRTIAELCRQFSNQTKILILVPTVLLLYQMQQDIADYIGMTKEDIGLIGDGNYITRNLITVAIPDTLASKIQNLDSEVISYLHSVNVVVFDESHTTLIPTVFAINDYLINTEYRFGLSATPTLDNFSEALIGVKLHEFSVKDSMKSNAIETPEIIFHKVTEKINITSKLANFKFEQFTSKEMKIYNNLYDKVICSNSYRNQLAASIVQQELEEDRIILVLVKKVATSGGTVNHAKIMQTYLAALGINFETVHGKSKNKQELLDKLANEEIKGLIASVGILSEGVSINSISSLVNLSAGSNEKDFIQRAGRALRKGRLQPRIHDFVDCQYPFSNQSKTRLETAKKEYGSENVIVL